jgi:cytochrome c5
MNRRTIFVCAVLGLALLAAAAVYAEFESGYYSPANLGSIAQAAPRHETENASYRVESYSLFRPQLEPGEGRDLVDAYCNTCHSTRYVTMQPPLPAATWEAEVTKMAKSYGMSIPDDVTPKIIQYLQTHYTPETRKR